MQVAGGDAQVVEEVPKTFLRREGRPVAVQVLPAETIDVQYQAGQELGE